VLKNFWLRLKQHKLSFRDAPSVGNCRPEATGPESILPIVVMDSGFALRAPRNDDRLICPTGKSTSAYVSALSSPIRKNISVFQKSNLLYMLTVPSHMRGVSRSSRTLERDAVDAAASGAMRSQGGSMRPVSDRTARGRKTLPPSLKFRRTGT
jgi:hypothetical protein